MTKKPVSAGAQARPGVPKKVRRTGPPSPLLAESPLILGGCPRSGTTFLQLLLAATGVVAVTNETHLFSQFIGPAVRRYRNMAHKLVEGRRNVGIHQLVDSQELEAVLRQVSLEVLSRIDARQPNCQFVCEKTPENLLWWKEISDLFPKATFIASIRDPRSVVVSNIHAGRTWAYGANWASGSVEDIAFRWCQYCAEIDALNNSKNNLVVVKYERLIAADVAYFESKLKKIGLKVPKSKVSEAFAKTNIDRVRNIQDDADWPWPISQEPKGFFRVGKKNSWIYDLSEAEIQKIEEICADYMQKYDYPKASEIK